MWKKTLGSVFIIASAILYSSMYISAAIYGSAITSKSKEIFSTYLGFIKIKIIKFKNILKSI